MTAASEEKTETLPTLQNPLSTLEPFLKLNPFYAVAQQYQSYCLDAWQRSVLFLDILRQRGNIHFEYLARSAPNVLNFKAVVLIDGRDLLDPINYLLLRILPPDGVVTDPAKRPFMVFDPRAGHGPGIGGMKKDSEVGIALANGHPVYFVTFLPRPEKNQTIEDVNAAEAMFVAKVIEWHPDAPKPCLIGNCQAGWQIAMMSATNPQLPGALILAGAPMSYWAGTYGVNPMRYLGGMIGGSWMNALLSDIGGGLFDGAWLIYNFENNNPANTFWKKDYNVYSNVDTEGKRFLDFERWWGSPVLLNGDEIQFIVDELFIGNHLSAGKIHTPSGMRIDLRNIKSPIIVFCSYGDDITSVQQAMDWVLDLYSCDDDIIASGQTIIYSLHKTIGHLGIFVSASVAKKEHLKFITNIDMIETMPPGLYEAVFTSKSEDKTNADLVAGDYIMRFEKRGLADIRALGGNSDEDDRRFAAVARLSENVQGLYYTYVSPIVRSMITEQTAETIRNLHPIRMRFTTFSDKNPLLAGLEDLAAHVRETRKPVEDGNIFLQVQTAISNNIIQFYDAINDAKNQMTERVFLNVFGSPLLQAMVGLRTVRPYAKPAPSRDVEQERERNRRLMLIAQKVETGGLAEAMVRAMLYVIRAGNAVDEREFTLLMRLRQQSNSFPTYSFEEFKTMVRQQYMLLVLDEDKAIATIPQLLEECAGEEKQALATIREIVSASGTPTFEEERRLRRLEEIFVPAKTAPRRRKNDRPMAEPDA